MVADVRVFTSSITDTPRESRLLTGLKVVVIILAAAAAIAKPLTTLANPCAERERPCSRLGRLCRQGTYLRCIARQVPLYGCCSMPVTLRPSRRRVMFLACRRCGATSHRCAAYADSAVVLLPTGTGKLRRVWAADELHARALRLLVLCRRDAAGLVPAVRLLRRHALLPALRGGTVRR